MSQARKYIAASVPRFLRQTKLGYLLSDARQTQQILYVLNPLFKKF
jgi:hypothetical protein